MSQIDVDTLEGGELVTRQGRTGVIVSNYIHRKRREIVCIQWIGGGSSIFARDGGPDIWHDIEIKKG